VAVEQKAMLVLLILAVVVDHLVVQAAQVLL
jgi:hypothetical protein